ncbi:dipeptidase PepV [Caproicibacterium sp. NSD3]
MNINDWIDSQKDALTKDLQKCIQIRSVYEDDKSGYPYGEKVQECLQYVLSLAKDMGFAVQNWENHIGWCEYGNGPKMVAVLGHLDVVPEGEGWSIPPYEGLVTDGKIYGRGSMDDKGPTIAALYALKAIKESGLPLKHRIRILFGVNEETGSADMKFYIKNGGEIPVMGFTPDGEYPVINGEKGLITEEYTKKLTQSGNIKLLHLQGGTAHNIVPNHATAEFTCSPILTEKALALKEEKVTVSRTNTGFKIEAAGIGAHGGTPWEGENAIGRLMLSLSHLPLTGDIAQAIQFLAEKIGMECDGKSLKIAMEDQDSGPLTFNLGIVSGDEHKIYVKINYRYPVSKSFDDCGPIVEKAFAEAGFERTSLTHKKSLYMAPDSELVQKLLKVYRQQTGQDAKPKCIGGGTYAKTIPNTLAFGPIFPGDEVREHKPDEFMEISRLIENCKIIAAAMYELAK